MVLFGRDKELARIRALLRSPRESALAITGNHGSGKSALLAEIPKLHGFRTVAVRASPSESSWPFSGLTALLNGLDNAALTPAIEKATDRPGTKTDLSALSSTLLAALRQQPEARTVAVVDDADELDSASQAVLGFMARRLAGTGIVLIISMRREAPGSAFVRLNSLQVPDLSQGDAVRMLESIPAGQPTNAAVIHAVATAAQGNPLAAVELFKDLTQRQLQGQDALPFPFSCAGSFEAERAATISGLSSGGRRALEILSLSYRSSVSLLEGMAGGLRSGADEILSAGLAVRAGSHLIIRNQMLRGHVYSAISPEQRSAYHQALAATAETADPAAWPWHLSYAPTPRRDTSSSLLRLAVEQVRAGDVQPAVEYVERALMINPWEAATFRRQRPCSPGLRRSAPPSPIPHSCAVSRIWSKYWSDRVIGVKLPGR